MWTGQANYWGLVSKTFWQHMQVSPPSVASIYELPFPVGGRKNPGPDSPQGHGLGATGRRAAGQAGGRWTEGSWFGALDMNSGNL